MKTKIILTPIISMDRANAEKKFEGLLMSFSLRGEKGQIEFVVSEKHYKPKACIFFPRDREVPYRMATQNELNSLRKTLLVNGSEGVFAELEKFYISAWGCSDDNH